MVCGESLHPADSGGRVEKLRAVEAMVAAGVEVFVYTSDHSSALSGAVPHEWSVPAVAQSRRPFLNASIASPLIPYQVSSHRTASDSVLALISEWRPTHVMAQHEWTLPLGRKFAHYFDIPMLLRSHNVEHELMKSMFQNSTFGARKGYLAAEYFRSRLLFSRRGFYRGVSCVLPISPEVSDWYSALGLQTYCIPPVLLCRESSNVAAPTLGRAHRIGFVGNLAMPGAVDGLVWFISEVFPRVRERLPTAEFHIGGKGATTGISNYFRRWRGDGVIFHGQVADLDQFYRRIVCVVNPVFSGSGVNMKVGDALTHNLPLVTTIFGARGLGTLADAVAVSSNAKDMAILCTRLLDDPVFHAQQVLGQSRASSAFTRSAVGTLYRRALEGF
ncbi:glycosyltransferase [Gordonia mangrovi]